MGQSLGKNSKREPNVKFSDFKGLQARDFDILWDTLINHEDASLALKKDTFEDIMKTFLDQYSLLVDVSESTFLLHGDTGGGFSEAIKRFFDSFVPPPAHENSCADAIQLLVSMLLLSNLSKKSRIETLYQWFSFFDEDEEGLEKDDLLLPIKTIMNSVMVCTDVNDFSDDEIQHIRDEICVEIDKSIGAKQQEVLRDSDSSSLKQGDAKSGAKPPTKYKLSDIWLWAESSPIVSSWIKLEDSSTEDSDDEGSQHGGPDEELEDHDDEVHSDIPKRSHRQVMEMDPDSSIGSDPFQNAAEAGGDEFMAVLPYKGTVQAIHSRLKKLSSLQTKQNQSGKGTVCNSYDSNGCKVNPVTFSGEDFTDPGKNPTEARLTLEWVHGYRGSDCRNNVFYSKNEKAIVYFTAAVGVKLTKNETGHFDQKFAFHHTDDILSMATYDNGTDIVHFATGEIGKRPKICVWDPKDMSLLNTLKGFHSRGVNQLKFNNSGKYILSLGVDDNHSLVVYDWANNSMIHNSKSHKSKVFAIDFEHLGEHLGEDATTDMENFYSCGDKHLLFWHKKGRGFVSKKATFGSKKKKKGKSDAPILMSLTSVRYEKSTWVYAGCRRGHIYMWNQGGGVSPTSITDASCKDPFDLKDFGAVNVLKRLKVDKQIHLVAAGTAGLVHFLKPDGETLTVLKKFDIYKTYLTAAPTPEPFKSLSSEIRAIDFQIKDDKISMVIGTKASEIYEITGLDISKETAVAETKETAVECWMQGHSTAGSKHGSELWGLAVYPCNGGKRKPIYATSGDDKRVRVWQIGDTDERHRLIAISDELDAMSRAVAWSGNGQELAVGLGGRVGARVSGMKSAHDGAVVILGYSNSKLTHLKKLKPHPTDWISDIKYSLTGTLAVGAHDRSIYLYNSKTYEFRAKCKGMSSYVSHLDFSLDGEIIQSNDGSYELLFWNAKNGKQIKRAPADTCWDTWTSTLGWPVQGIWPPGGDGTDINAVAFLPKTDQTDPKRTNIYSGILATADDFGKVKLFNSPCLAQNASGVEFRGHSSHVTNVRFANNLEKGMSTRLISTGGEDRSVFQWKYEGPDGDEQRSSHAHNPDVHSDDEVHDEDQKNDEKHDEDMDAFEFGEGGGDEFMAVKPWLGAIKAPSNPPASNKSAPDADLELKVVHGYAAFDTRDNVRYTKEKRIAYHAASLGILAREQGGTEKNSFEQEYNQDNTDDIKCLAVSKDGDFIATGEVGKVPKIIVWDQDCSMKKTLSGFHKREVSLLAFSYNDSGEYLASIGQDENHSLCIYNHQTGNMVANAKGEKNAVFALEFVREKVADHITLVQCGINHVRVWTMNGRNLSSKKVNMGIKPGSLSTWLSLTSVPEKHMLLACASGDINVIQFGDDGKPQLKTTVNTGHGPINSIYSTTVDTEHRVVSGCIEGIIRLWDWTSDGLRPGKNNKIFSDCSVKEKQRDHWNKMWKQFEGPNKFNVMRTVYKTNGDGKNKSLPKISIPVEKALPQIRSVCLSKDGKTLLVGTRGAEILEIDYSKEIDTSKELDTSKEIDYSKEIVKVITRGHFKDEVWGLAVEEGSNFYVTAGDDGYVRVWNLREEKQETSTRLGQFGYSDPVMARACAISPNASKTDKDKSKMLAVGLGGNVGRGKTKHDGKVLIFALIHSGETGDSRKLKVLIGDINKKSPPLKNAKGYISDMKFSVNTAKKGYSGYLAVGSHDRNIYLYDASMNEDAKDVKVALKHKLKGHNSYISHIDFSSDGKWLQSNCGAYELLFWDVKRGRQQTSSGAMRDVQWATFTCVLGWPVQGIWPKCADGTDINAVDRSSSKDILITSDDFGKLKLFRYPCLEPGASYGQESGHSSHVTNVRWMSGVGEDDVVLPDKYVISTGGNDRCIFQWDRAMSHADGDAGHHGSTGGDMDSAEHTEEDFSDPFAHQGEDEGDQSMAMKPWKGQIVAPSNRDEARAGTPTKPRFKLELEHACGYQAQDPNSRGNLRFTAAGDIVYHTAAIAIVQKIPHGTDELEDGRGLSGPTQRYFTGHDDDIVCLTMDTSGRFVASGQMQSEHQRKVNPAVKVWDADSCREICTLGGFHKRSVTCVAFSPDCKRIVSVGNDDDHSVALWETQSGTWEDGKSVASARGDKSTVLFACFTPSAGKGVVFVTGGVRHVRFWSLAGRSLKSKLGKGKSKKGPLTQLCGCYVGDVSSNSPDWRIVTGDASGMLNVWACEKNGVGTLETDNVFSNKSSKHQKPPSITTLAPCLGKEPMKVKFIVTGAADGEIHILKWENKVLSQHMSMKLGEAKPVPSVLEIRSVTVDMMLKKCVVGTKGSEIYVADMETENEPDKFGQFTLLEAGHNKDELWGLAVNPKDNTLLATSGDDGTARVWKRNKGGVLSLHAICECRGMARAIAWADEETLVVGLGGRVGRRKISSRKRVKKGSTRSKDEETVDGQIDVFKLPKGSLSKPYSAHHRKDQPVKMDMDDSSYPQSWISDIKICMYKRIPIVAVSAHDSKVHLYRLTGGNDKMERIGICGKSSASVTHVDFGKRKKKLYVRTNDLSEEILRYEVPDDNASKKCTQITKLRDVRDIQWQSNTCVREWATEGIWPQGAASDDINSVCTSADNKLIVSADDHGHINLFNYPCTTAGASCITGYGHSSHVMNVRFSHGRGEKVKTEDTKIYSVGGNDRSLFQWKLTKL